MTCNVGGVDRAIRVAFGVLLIGFGAWSNLPVWAIGIIYAIGAIALVTGAIGFCPAWSLLRLSSCATSPKSKA